MLAPKFLTSAALTALLVALPVSASAATNNFSGVDDANFSGDSSVNITAGVISSETNTTADISYGISLTPLLSSDSRAQVTSFIVQVPDSITNPVFLYNGSPIISSDSPTSSLTEPVYQTGSNATGIADPAGYTLYLIRVPAVDAAWHLTLSGTVNKTSTAITPVIRAEAGWDCTSDDPDDCTTLIFYRPNSGLLQSQTPAALTANASCVESDDTTGRDLYKSDWYYADAFQLGRRLGVSYTGASLNEDMCDTAFVTVGAVTTATAAPTVAPTTASPATTTTVAPKPTQTADPAPAATPTTVSSNPQGATLAHTGTALSLRLLLVTAASMFAGIGIIFSKRSRTLN